MAAAARHLGPHQDTELLSLFTSTTGRIEGRRFTGLTAKNQRRVARAIRQARAAGRPHVVHPVARLPCRGADGVRVRMPACARARAHTQGLMPYTIQQLEGFQDDTDALSELTLLRRPSLSGSAANIELKDDKKGPSSSSPSASAA